MGRPNKGDSPRPSVELSEARGRRASPPKKRKQIYMRLSPHKYMTAARCPCYSTGVIYLFCKLSFTSSSSCSRCLLVCRSYKDCMIAVTCGRECLHPMFMYVCTSVVRLYMCMSVRLSQAKMHYSYCSIKERIDEIVWYACTRSSTLLKFASLV